MNQPTNPERAQDKQDAAEVKNFTRSPNMLIFGYRELSPQEKWLYVCLKHLCGKRGTRHLALRYISEQTGISVGALSTSKDKKGNVNEGMIRHLHNAGLIHSEIKKKDGKGNAQYHITITDVWDLNQTFFIERAKSRSEFGQDTGQEEDESTEPVRISDEPVQSSDKLVQNPNASVRISDEPVRIPGQYQDYSKTTNKTDNKTTEQESDSANESQLDDSGSVEPMRTHSSQQSLSQDSPDESHTEQDKPGENETHAELSTLQMSSPQQSAKVDPASTRRRQPKAPKVDPAEIQRYLEVFDQLFQEVTGNPDEGYICSGEDRKELAALLEANLKKPRYVTPEKLRVVYLRLWNKPKDERTGFFWQEHMKIKNVCKQYPQEAMTLSVQASQKAAKNSNEKTVSGLKRWTPPGATPARA